MWGSLFWGFTVNSKQHLVRLIKYVPLYFAQILCIWYAKLNFRVFLFSPPSVSNSNTFSRHWLINIACYKSPYTEACSTQTFFFHQAEKSSLKKKSFFISHHSQHPHQVQRDIFTQGCHTGSPISVDANVLSVYKYVLSINFLKPSSILSLSN